jgi:lysophospholipase L1-like esterase
MRTTPLLLALVLVGCGGTTTTESPTNGQSSSSGGGSGSSSSGGSGSSSGGAGTDSGIPIGPPAGDGAKYGTFIVLGDSISDGGGEAPFFYDLLFKNDDATYPAYKGHDLSTKYPGITYVHKAIAGSVTDLYDDEQGQKIPTMASQIAGLTSNYPGDVLITITIGGNDLNYHSYYAISQQDAPYRTELTNHLQTELGELTKAGRLGSGKVTILEANIYDASDGKGNWQSGGHCGPNIDVDGKLEVQGFSNWNAIISQEITSTQGIAHPLDLHALFNGHGFNSNDMWYVADCLHPNKKGHHMLRSAYWQMLTGEAI